MDMAQGRRLTAEDWAHAALAAMGEQGLAGIAVEPLAARLGTTKGSFYWHFANRDALVEAALALWERAHTEAVIEAVDGKGDPAAVLHALFDRVTSGGGGAVEVSLLAAADHPLVAPTMRRVVGRRLGYVRDQFLALGCEPAEADRRALLAYTAYLGGNQLGVRVPTALPSDTASHKAYVDSVISLLLTGLSSGSRGGDAEEVG